MLALRKRSSSISEFYQTPGGAQCRDRSWSRLTPTGGTMCADASEPWAYRQRPADQVHQGKGGAGRL